MFIPKFKVYEILIYFTKSNEIQMIHRDGIMVRWNELNQFKNIISLIVSSKKILVKVKMMTMMVM